MGRGPHSSHNGGSSRGHVVGRLAGRPQAAGGFRGDNQGDSHLLAGTPACGPAFGYTRRVPGVGCVPDLEPSQRHSPPGPNNFRKLSNSALFINFAITKANPEAEQRLDHQCEIRDCPDLVRMLKHLKPFQVPHPHAPNTTIETFFTDKDRTTLTRLLEKFPVSTMERQKWAKLRPQSGLMTHYSLHSIKRGAAHRLWEAAAAGKIQGATAMTMLKHKDLSTSLGYAPDPRLVARAMGTHLGTTFTTA